MKVYKPFLVKNGFPLIVYIFEGFEKYGGLIEWTKESLNDISSKILERDKLTDPQYGIVFPWGDNETGFCDFHIYHDMNNSWENTNPSIRCSQWKLNIDGVLKKWWQINDYSKVNFCETAEIIRGTEGRHRRGTKNLQEFLSRRPVVDTSICNYRDF